MYGGKWLFVSVYSRCVPTIISAQHHFCLAEFLPAVGFLAFDFVQGPALTRRDMSHETLYGRSLECPVRRDTHFELASPQNWQAQVFG